jgi:hypothetical protein
VILNVVLVKDLLLTVSLVVKEEFNQNPDVFVKKVNTSILPNKCVKLVTIHVQLVLLITFVKLVLMQPEILLM